MIHRFSLFGHHIVLDVCSGAVHLMDRPAWELSGHLAAPLDEACPKALYGALPELSARETDEIYAELYALYRDGTLFSEDDYGVFADRMVRSPVKAMCLNVSHDCNLRCEYCFAGRGDYGQERVVMDAETGRRAIDFLLEHAGDREFLEVDFFGGEPLMNFEVVKETLAYARERGKAAGKTFRFTITTNGLLLDDEKIEYINREMDNVVLSLDGRREVNDRVRARAGGGGCYDAVAPRFQKLVERRGAREYYVRGTFTKYNKDFSRDVLNLAELGFDQVSVEPVVGAPEAPWALTPEDLPEVFAEYERLAQRLVGIRREGGWLNFFHFMLDLDQGPCVIKRLRGCGCGNEYVAVTPGGDIYPCHQFIGHPQWKMGSVHDKSFDEAMKDRFAAATVYAREECASCWARFYCSGGCSANNMQYQGDILKAHTLSCEMEKKRLECAIAMQAELMMEEDAVTAQGGTL